MTCSRGPAHSRLLVHVTQKKRRTCGVCVHVPWWLVLVELLCRLLNLRIILRLMQIRAAVGVWVEIVWCNPCDAHVDLAYVLYKVSGDVTSTYSLLLTHLHFYIMYVCTIFTGNLVKCQKRKFDFRNLALCFSVREKGAEGCRDLIDAFQACIKTLSEGS